MQIAYSMRRPAGVGNPIADEAAFGYILSYSSRAGARTPLAAQPVYTARLWCSLAPTIIASDEDLLDGGFASCGVHGNHGEKLSRKEKPERHMPE